MRKLWMCALAALLLCCAEWVPGRDSDQRREDREQRRRREKIEDLSRKLSRRLAVPNPAKEHGFLHEQASALLERARQAREDAYLFDRLAAATNALLESSEEIFEAREPERDKDDDDQREAAVALQRHYFRIQQAEYFAKMGNEEQAGEYVKQSRSLYQQARRAYDQKQYRQARKLGEASSYIVRALENLAQAAVRIPEPPRL